MKLTLALAKLAALAVVIDAEASENEAAAQPAAAATEAKDAEPQAATEASENEAAAQPAAAATEAEEAEPQAAATPAGTEFEKYDGALEGGDLVDAEMTPAEAEKYCEKLPECVGFSYYNPNPTYIWFKKTWDLLQGPGNDWTSVKVKRAEQALPTLAQLNGPWTARWPNGETASIHVQDGAFTVYGGTYELTDTTPVTFTRLDGTVQSLESFNGLTLTWSTTDYWSPVVFWDKEEVEQPADSTDEQESTPPPSEEATDEKDDTPPPSEEPTDETDKTSPPSEEPSVEIERTEQALPTLGQLNGPWIARWPNSDGASINVQDGAFTVNGVAHQLMDAGTLDQTISCLRVDGTLQSLQSFDGLTLTWTTTDELNPVVFWDKGEVQQPADSTDEKDSTPPASEEATDEKDSTPPASEEPTDEMVTTPPPPKEPTPKGWFGGFWQRI